MSRHLRQSGQLSRLLRASQKASLQRDACLISISRAAATPTLRTGRAHQLRYYASDRPPKPSKGSKKPKGNAVDPASKHTDKSSPQKDNDSIERFPLPSGWVYLTDEEYILLRAAFQLSSASNLPFGLSPVKTIHDAIDRARYTGAPIELRDLCYKLKNRWPSISELQSLALNFTKVWMRYNEMSDQNSTENSSQNKNDKKTNEVNGEESARPFNGRDQQPNNQKNSGKGQQGQKQQGQKQQGQGQQGQGQQGQGKQGQGQQGQGQSGQGQPGQGQPGQGGGTPATSISIFQTMGILFFVFYLLNSSSSQQRQITWEEARTAYLDKGLVQKFVVIDGSKVRLVLRPDSGEIAGEEGPKLLSYTFSIGSVDTFERKLEQAQDELRIPSNQRIPVSYESGESTLGNVLYAFGPTLLFIGIIIYTQRKLGGRGGGSGMFNFGKSRAQRFNAESTVKVKFSDVAGLEEAKTEIMEFVSFLKQPEKFEKLGAKIPRGAILSGPPGTGKTLLAKATAGESGVPFFSVSGSEFVEMFVGVGPSRVRDLFSEGRKNAPCIIFIDEIDAIGRSRQNSGKGYGGNDEREATLNQILTEMDGFNTREQVVVLAGTNRADVLDSALMRPGRFDRHIYVDRPTMSGRKEIFRVYLAKIVTSENIDNLVGRLSTLTPGFSGADISNVVNEAALIAARSNATEVKMEHFESAIERVICGLERKSLVLNPEEKKTIAYHEAGHAICGWFLRYADPLLKVSIIPRGQGALGYAQYLPQDAYLMSTKQLMDRMAMTMGGRVSEELNFTTVTTGASDDFKKVSQMARNMVTQWGMSDVVGHVHFDNDPNQLQKPFAESTAQKIDDEVKRIVEEAHKRCKDLLTEKKKEVELIAEELLKKEVLVRDDMVRLLGERPFGDNAEFEKYFGGKEKSAPPPFPGEGGDGKGPAPGGDFPEPSPAFGRVSKEETSGMR